MFFNIVLHFLFLSGTFIHNIYTFIHNTRLACAILKYPSSYFPNIIVVYEYDIHDTCIYNRKIATYNISIYM